MYFVLLLVLFISDPIFSSFIIQFTSSREEKRRTLSVKINQVVWKSNTVESHHHDLHDHICIFIPSIYWPH